MNALTSILEGMMKPIDLNAQDRLVIYLGLCFLEDDIAYELEQFMPYQYRATDVKHLLEWFGQIQCTHSKLLRCPASKESLRLTKRQGALLMMAINKGVSRDFLDYHIQQEARLEADIWIHRRLPHEATVLDVSERVMALEERYFPALGFKEATLEKFYRVCFKARDGIEKKLLSYVGL